MIPTPKDHAEKFKLVLDARQCEELRAHIVANLDANGHVEEHVIDVSRFESSVVAAIAKECETRGWTVSHTTDADKSPKLVLHV